MTQLWILVKEITAANMSASSPTAKTSVHAMQGTSWMEMEKPAQVCHEYPSFIPCWWIEIDNFSVDFNLFVRYFWVSVVKTIPHKPKHTHTSYHHRKPDENSVKLLQPAISCPSVFSRSSFFPSFFIFFFYWWGLEILRNYLWKEHFHT